MDPEWAAYRCLADLVKLGSWYSCLEWIEFPDFGELRSALQYLDSESQCWESGLPFQGSGSQCPGRTVLRFQDSCCCRSVSDFQSTHPAFEPCRQPPCKALYYLELLYRATCSAAYWAFQGCSVS